MCGCTERHTLRGLGSFDLNTLCLMEWVRVCLSRSDVPFDVLPKVWSNLRFARLDLGPLGNGRTCVQSYKRFIRNIGWSVETNMFWQTRWVMDYIEYINLKIKEWTGHLDSFFTSSCYIVLCVIMCTPHYNCLPRHNADSPSIPNKSRTCFFFFTLK